MTPITKDSFGGSYIYYGIREHGMAAIMNGLSLKKLDVDGFDVVTFDKDDNEYKFAQGYENFIEKLLNKFPNEENAIKTYCNKI